MGKEGWVMSNRLTRLRLQDVCWLISIWAGSTMLSDAGGKHLTYHEALVAEGTREMLASGQFLHPTINHIAWLEKPPLPWWLASLASAGQPNLVSERTARLPSQLACLGMILGSACLAARFEGPKIGFWTGAIQATTYWTALRGQLAEADIQLACVICWALIGLALIRCEFSFGQASTPGAAWLLLGSAGAASLVKGIGFGAILIISIFVVLYIIDRDRRWIDHLKAPGAWMLAVSLTLIWPTAVLLAYGRPAWSLWFSHVVDRFTTAGGNGPFAGQSFIPFLVHVLGQALPWTPLALVGAWRSVQHLSWVDRGRNRRRRWDEFLLAWAVVPVLLIGLARGRNPHYVIAAQIPWSIWAARVWTKLLRAGTRYGSALPSNGLISRYAVLSMAMMYGIGFAWVARWLDHREAEWVFYESLRPLIRQHPYGTHLVLLYDEWDRLPYPSPLGNVPHDLAVRIFYLGRMVEWRRGVMDLAVHLPGAKMAACAGARMRAQPFLIIGRKRDWVELRRIGRVELLRQGPSARWDRDFGLVCFYPRSPWLDRFAPICPCSGLCHRVPERAEGSGSLPAM